ncbi:MAG: tetratricopeptide repeat protein [Acidobacteria bacterium]|nr:tetratricopeptide repeat protein [Acidobacteriota bacterium]
MGTAPVLSPTVAYNGLVFSPDTSAGPPIAIRRVAGFLLLALLPLTLTASPPDPSPEADPDPAALLREAEDLVRAGRESDALGRLRLARGLDPGSPEIAFRLGSLLGAMGFLHEAREELAGAARRFPERPEVRVELGAVLERMLDRDGALAAYGEVLERNPSLSLRVRALVSRGRVHEAMGDLDQARAAFEEALRANPASTSALAHLGLVLRRTGDFDAALAAWRRFLEIRPGNGWVESWVRETEESRSAIAAARARLDGGAPEGPRAWTLIAERQLDAGNTSACLEALDRAIRSGAGPELLRFRAEVLQWLERWPDADRDLRLYLKEFPGDRTAMYRLALGRRRLGDCRAEARTWRRVDATAGSDPLPFRMVLETLRCPGGGRKAGTNAYRAEGERLARVLEDRPGDTPLRLRLALLREAEGRLPEAFDAIRLALRPDPHASYPIREFRRLVADHPGAALDFAERLRADLRSPPVDPADLILYAYLAGNAGDVRVAMRLLRAAVDLAPDHPGVHVAHAQAAATLAGRPKAAVELLRETAQRHPGSASTLLALGLLLLEHRMDREAVEVGERLVGIAPDSYHALGFLGSAYSRAGLHEEAVGYLLAALRADPADPEGTVRFQLALSLAAAEKRNEARWVLRTDLPWTPAQVYRRGWDLVREYFFDRTFAGQDWSAWRGRFEGRLADREEAYRAVVEMLSVLGDRYTRLRTAEETEAQFLSRRSEEIELDGRGRPLPPSRSVVLENLSGGIQYIRLTNLSDPTLVEKVREALRAGDRRGLILDLRGNPGGLQSESETLGSMFLEDGTLLGEVQDGAGRRRIEAGGEDPIDPDLPVVVLVDENTGSAAETLAGALHDSGRARLVGRTTQGKGSAQVSQLLPGGAMVLVTAARHVTPGGSGIEGAGIEPDVPFPASGEPGEEAAWIEKAREVLEREGNRKEE